METAETAAERAQIDRAIAGVLFHAGLRRSEAADLRWGDVEPAASIPGALTIRVRTSKTNRDGEATDVRLAKNGAAAALTALRPANAAPEALVFRGLNGQSIGRRFAAAANAAGVEGVTAHSGPGRACQRTHGGRSQHHRDDARGRLEDCPHGRALQRRRISRARRGCQVPLRAHPPTRPRLGFDAIDQAPRFPRRDRHRVRASWSNGGGLAQRGSSDSGLVPAWLDPAMTDCRRARRVHPGGDPPERTHRAKPLY